MNAEAQREADRWKLEEFCKSFCFEDEKYKAVLLDTRNWYCWAFDGDEDERVRDSAEVAIAGRRCLEMQDGAYFSFKSVVFTLLAFIIISLSAAIVNIGPV